MPVCNKSGKAGRSEEEDGVSKRKNRKCNCIIEDLEKKKSWEEFLLGDFSFLSRLVTQIFACPNLREFRG